MAPTYDEAECEAYVPFDSSTTVSRSADTGRRPKPSEGIFGVFHLGCPGDCEYTEDPTIVLALVEKRAKRDCDCGAGEFSTGNCDGSGGAGDLSTSWSGRGVLIPKMDIDDLNILLNISLKFVESSGGCP